MFWIMSHLATQQGMVLELHVWGPAFGLASIEPDCIATIAYCQRVIPQGQWSLVADHNPTVGATGTSTPAPLWMNRILISYRELTNFVR